MFTPIKSADLFRSLNESVSTKCVVVAQPAQEWTAVAGALLSRRTKGTVIPDVVTEEDGMTFSGSLLAPSTVGTWPYFFRSAGHRLRRELF